MKNRKIDMAAKRMKIGIVVVFAIGLALVVVSPSSAKKLQVQPDPCLYAFEWIHSVRFPLQADPHASYSYVIVPKLPAHGIPVGFLIDAEFPYAAWFSWTIYGENALAVSLARDFEIIPDAESTNPFVYGNPISTPNRSYRLLLLPPDIPPGKTIAPLLADIPAKNRLTIPIHKTPTGIVYRVYQAFPLYDLGGSSGPTSTPFPSVYAVNYETGERLDCSQYDAVPSTIGRLPTDTPEVYNLYYGTEPAKDAPKLKLRALAESNRLLRAPNFAALRSKIGWQYAPEIDPTLVTFTRPPLAPGSDVSSIPTPDQCAGYLGARVDPHRIALIRIPHIAETPEISQEELFPDDPQAVYISLTMYGASVNPYDPGESESTSLANAEFQIDEPGGGSTILIWPRNLSGCDREELFAYARAHDWALMRGGRVGPLTTANLLVRIKRSSNHYYGAYTPLEEYGRCGVPCYFDGAGQGASWIDIENAPDPMHYVASFQNLGNAAPQGVHCASVAEVLNGSCLNRLEAHIEKTGGEYYNPGYIPPPNYGSDCNDPAP